MPQPHYLKDFPEKTLWKLGLGHKKSDIRAKGLSDANKKH